MSRGILSTSNKKEGVGANSFLMWKENNGDKPMRNEDNEDLSSDSNDHITAMS